MSRKALSDRSGRPDSNRRRPAGSPLSIRQELGLEPKITHSGKESGDRPDDAKRCLSGPDEDLSMAPLVDRLAVLGLRYAALQLDDVVALATKRRWRTTQLLEHLVESEQQDP